MKNTIRLLIAFFVINTFFVSLNSKMNSLYSDHKSFSKGDILTILIVEQSSASTSAGSKTDRSFDHSVGSSAGQGPLGFIPLSSMGINSKNSAEGDAETSREGQLKSKITARIIKVEKNDNLIIEGSRSLEINGEEEITKIRGTVRPEDIQADNTVYSYLIADAEISYKGKGAVKDGSKIGFLSRIFNFLF